MSNHHDALFQAIFSDPADALGLIRSLLPPELAERLTVNNLERVASDSDDGITGALRADIVYRVVFDGVERARVLVFLEHQSTVDGRMPLRFLGYALRGWEAAPVGEPLPAILPVVVYNGHRRWRGPRSLSEMVGAQAKGLEPLREFMPELKFMLIDLPRIPEDRLPAEGLGRLALLMLKWGRLPDAWRRLLRERDVLKELRRRGRGLRLVPLLSYLLRVQAEPPEPAVVAELAALTGPKPLEETMGYFDTMTRKAFSEGIEKGMEKGMEKGLHRGISQGRRDTLERILLGRFEVLPPDLLHRLRSGDAQALDQIERGLFTATAAEDLLVD